MSIWIKTDGRLTPAVSFPAAIEVEPWVRPADWLTLPTTTAGEQKIVGLYAVEDHPANHVVIQVAGAYTVDWGDGSATENFAANAAANHTYTFASLPANTLTSHGFRQAIITVTPQAGQTLTSFNITAKPSGSSTGTFVGTAWLDIEGAGSGLNSLIVSGVNTSTTSRPRLLERFVWRGTNAITNISNAFFNASSLQEFDMDTATVTNFGNLFAECSRLRTTPLLNTAAGTSFAGMFSGCRSLVTLPSLSTGNGTSFNSMFFMCSSLVTVPQLDVSKGTDFSSMFNGCYSLREVPSLNTGLATTLNGMFTDCRSLESVGALDTANSLNVIGLFQNCYALKTSPALNVAKVASLSNLFASCFSLETVGAITNTNLVTNFAGMFSNCYSLEVGPELDTSAGTNFGSMFSDCRSLRVIPLYNTASATSVSTMLFGCAALRIVPALDLGAVTSAANQANLLGNATFAKVDLRNIKWSLVLTNLQLSSDELNRVYTNLATVAGQTITVSNNPGVSGDDPTIATAKGWTVTGS